MGQIVVNDERLRLQLHRMRMLALLDEMDARNPLTAADQKAGEKQATSA